VVKSSSLEVELDVFSGRPNPRWTLAAPEADRLRRQIRSLRSSAPEQHIPDLGFRGFIVHDAAGSVRVFRKTVIVPAARPRRFLLDTPHIEDTLFDEATRRGFQQLLPKA